MRRITVFFLSLLMIISTSVPVMGQSSSYRVPTRVLKTSNQTSPSFRGGQVTSPEGQQDYDYAPYGSQVETGEEGIQMMPLGYQVHVLGEVASPGTYRIPASGRLSNALQLAGGLAENGSERKIELRRRGKKIQLVDLLRFTLYGNLADNPYLLDNDVVFVPLRKSVIQVVGAVRRPNTYELRNEKNLKQVVDLAGSFNAATAMSENIRVIRFVEGQKQVETVPINDSAMNSFKIKNGDVVVVPDVVTKETEFDYNVAAVPGGKVFYPSYEDRVFVLGGVRQPGAYAFSPYYNVNQYISLAGGITQSGKEKYRIIDINGKSRKATETDRVNPGDTIMIKQRWMTPAGWLGFALGIASFGLSASATILAITK